MMIRKTYHLRLKDSQHRNWLKRKSGSVNFTWNYCKETALFAWKRDRKWLSHFDLTRLLKAAGSEVELHQHCVEATAKEFTVRRNQHKKFPRWRSRKRSLGWIPFSKTSIKIKDDHIVFMKRKIKFWKSQELIGTLKSGSICEDSQGHWYLNVVAEYEPKIAGKTGKDVGIDLGLKTQLTCSDGTKYQRENITKELEEKLAKSQRARKKKQVTKIHAKIKNKRKDWNHKVSKEIVEKHDKIYIGNVKSRSFIRKKSKLAKSTSDASWYAIKCLLEYKAISLGKHYEEVNEAYSTATCSVCSARSGPSGLSALGVRSWDCPNCGAHHDRDVNAARNILKTGLGCETLLEEPQLV